MTLEELIARIEAASKKVQPGVMPTDILSLLADLDMQMAEWVTELKKFNESLKEFVKP